LEPLEKGRICTWVDDLIVETIGEEVVVNKEEEGWLLQ